MPRITVTSVFVADQEQALLFYTGTLRFRLRHDMPAGEHRRLTVVSSQDSPGPELLLEPNVHPAARAYQAALRADGTPAASFTVNDVAAETARLRAAGVRIVQEPATTGRTATAVIDDTCGNLIQLAQTL